MTANIKISNQLIDLLTNLPKSTQGQFTKNQRIVTIVHDNDCVNLELLISLQNEHREFYLHALIVVDSSKQIEIVNLQGSPDHFKKSEIRYLDAMFNMAIRILEHHHTELIPVKNQNPKWKKTLQNLLDLASIGQHQLISNYTSNNFLKLKYMLAETRIWYCLEQLRFLNLALSIDWRDIEDLPELAVDLLKDIYVNFNFTYQELDDFDIETDDETILIDDLNAQLNQIGIHLISLETHTDNYFFLFSKQNDYHALIQSLDSFSIEHD